MRGVDEISTTWIEGISESELSVELADRRARTRDPRHGEVTGEQIEKGRI